MKNIILSIEYCTAWGYLPKAVGLAQTILKEHKNAIATLTLIPSSGGVFEIKFNNDLIFSKKESDRFPEENEIESKVRELIVK